MFWSAIGDILPQAVGVALSPLPIVAVILLLSTPRARSNGVSFLVGWLLGVVALAGVVILSSSGADRPDSMPSDVTAVVQTAIGVLFMVLAWREWGTASKRIRNSPPGWERSTGSSPGGPFSSAERWQP